MDSIKNSISRIHPLVAAAAVSVIMVSAVGTAAIAGWLPNSHGAPEPASMNNMQPLAQAAGAPGYAAANANAAAYAPAGQQGDLQGAQPVQAAYGQPLAAQAAPAPAPVVIEKTIIKEVPVKSTSHTHHHSTSYARNDGYAPAPAARPAPQPNYMAIGTGAVVGGLLGNQVGSGNGRKLATVAGVIGGGFLGNQIANQNR